MYLPRMTFSIFHDHFVLEFLTESLKSQPALHKYDILRIADNN